MWEVRQAALKWACRATVGVVASLAKPASDYEDGTEFSEGTAKYVEYRRASKASKGREPSHDMWLVQGFRGYGDLFRAAIWPGEADARLHERKPRS